MSGLLMWYIKPYRSQTTVIYEYSFSAISNMLSSWCQYEALRYVSFPASTLFKSFKLVPVMVMGKILGNKACKFLMGAKIYFIARKVWLLAIFLCSSLSYIFTVSLLPVTLNVQILSMTISSLSLLASVLPYS